MKNGTISILGCGWLGLELGKSLVQKGFQVKGSTTTTEKLSIIEAAGIAPYLIQVSATVMGDEVAAFFNTDLLVLNIPPSRRNPNIVVEHPKQVQAILEILRKSQVQKLIFISSTGVYGNENRVVTEADSLNPERNSGKALVQVEQLLQKQTDVQVTILRLAGLVGGNRKAGKFLAGRKDIPNGDAFVNLVHRVDCIGVIEKVIELERWGAVYNVCADQHPRKRAYYKYQARKEGLEPPTFKVDAETAYKIVANDKVKMELGYQFQFPDPMEF